jgi:hypothetical protein
MEITTRVSAFWSRTGPSGNVRSGMKIQDTDSVLDDCVFAMDSEW